MRHPPPGRAFWPAIAFLVAFFILLLIVSHRFLLPALRVSQGIDSTGRKHLAAISALVLTVVLFCLLVLLLMAFRPGRLLFSRRTEAPSKTDYIDAWQESADRMPMPRDDDEADDPDPAK
jgi:protein-S-isoprenylcysteine O-methyltransferase Ste14